MAHTSSLPLRGSSGLALVMGLCFLSGSCDSTSGTLTMAETARLTVLSPLDGARVYFGDQVLFDLEIDVEAGSVEEISWVSSLDAELGNADHFYRYDLSTGRHEITVTVRFVDGSNLRKTLTLVVDPRNQNAIAGIILPDADSLWYYRTDPRSFEAAAWDSAGYSLSADSYRWSSSRDGELGQRRELPVHELSLGRHDLSLTVVFGDQSTSSAFLTGLEIVEDPFGDTDLLNDRELWTEEDPEAPIVREAWSDWVRENSVPLRSLDSEDVSDLSFLDSLVDGKSIIQMGEVAHGIAEQNRLRVRLIKYLHERHGFDVVAFESGFFECSRTERSLNSLSAREALFNSLWTFWHTSDLLELFRYMKESRSTTAPLHLAGFDIHRTGEAIEARPTFFRDLVARVDSSLAQVVFDTDQALVALSPEDDDPYINEHYQELAGVYDRLIEVFQTHFDLFSQEDSEAEARSYLEAAVSARQYLDFRFDGNDNRRVYIRDAQMAASFGVIRDRLFPGKKVIVWAHNAHILKDSESVQPTPYTKMMGKWLDEAYSDELMTIISLGYRGIINYGPIHHIEITRPESIEAILYRTRKKYAFLDLAHQTRTDGNGWMFEYTFQTYLHSTAGAYDFSYIPANQFDAVIFIDTLSKASRISG